MSPQAFKIGSVKVPGPEESAVSIRPMDFDNGEFRARLDAPALAIFLSARGLSAGDQIALNKRLVDYQSDMAIEREKGVHLGSTEATPGIFSTSGALEFLATRGIALTCEDLERFVSDLPRQAFRVLRR